MFCHGTSTDSQDINLKMTILLAFFVNIILYFYMKLGHRVNRTLKLRAIKALTIIVNFKIGEPIGAVVALQCM